MEKQKSGDFYDGLDGSNQEYDGDLNHQTQPLNAEASEGQQEEWKRELERLEDEIQTLRSVLSVKIHQANEIKKKLGVTPLGEFKQDLRTGIQTIKESEVMQKTNETLHNWGESVAATNAYQKTNSALRSFGAYASKKLGDVRNSNAMKSMEGKISEAYTNVKTKVANSTSTNNMEDDDVPYGSDTGANGDGKAAGV